MFLECSPDKGVGKNGVKKREKKIVVELSKVEECVEVRAGREFGELKVRL